MLVLIGGAADHLIEPGTGMSRIDAAEFLEGPEKMVVPRLPFRRHEAAHGEGVDQAVVKAEILVDSRSRNFARFALRRGARCRMRLIERILGRIHAETVFDGLLNEGLGIDGAVQMIVQIGALGHALQEVAQSKRVVADALELLHSALGRGLHLLRRLCRCGR